MDSRPSFETRARARSSDEVRDIFTRRPGRIATEVLSLQTMAAPTFAIRTSMIVGPGLRRDDVENIGTLRPVHPPCDSSRLIQPLFPGAE